MSGQGAPRPGGGTSGGAVPSGTAGGVTRPGAVPGGAGVPGTAVPDGTPQGEQAPLGGAVVQGAPGRPSAQTPQPITRKQIIARAERWVTARVPYSLTSYWTDGYRQDCSGYVSMAWALGGNEWTGSLPGHAVRITREELAPGDILLFHNPANPTTGSHVTIFGGWADAARTTYMAYEQTKPHARRILTPYAYTSNSARYVPYRYKGVVAGVAGGAPSPVGATAFPGVGHFGPGADNAYVALLGELLMEQGGARFYSRPPGSRWSESHRLATQAFQRAQGWTGPAADGLPGPDTWSRLISGRGRSTPAAVRTDPDVRPGAAARNTPPFPGREAFRPGGDVERLGRQLVKKGYGRYYANGPGSRWSEADRRAVSAFQRAQGWRGAAADGYPGPETWRRLFA
ncbi:peptidoglycan-binding protein [Streptomyces sp. GC420]|uniref:peptidoglycan-binding protein n=1 Tax=Streptomyces sp. GC420 TaxID=2697568 RepID=UPI0028BEF3ED|nr:peptidoglycan-binding protein [Streptomyces sp. GC420]